MKASNTLKLLGLMLLGCSSEHTIATEVAAEQSVKTPPRTVCVDMCDYALDCGQLTEGELAACQTTCEDDCTRLETALPKPVAELTTQSEVSSQSIINNVSACYLASECSLDKGDECYPEYIGFKASYYERTSSGDLNGGTPVSVAGATGTSNCGFSPDNVTCETKMEQVSAAKQSWSLTCNRPNAETQEWTCQCFENGVETGQVTEDPGANAVGFEKLCWTAEELTCFNAGLPDC